MKVMNVLGAIKNHAGQIAAGVVLIGIGVVLGMFLIPAASPEQGEEIVHEHDEAVSAEPTIWTCAMHPQIQLPDPGQCPICTMNLIPLDSDGTDSGERRLVMSPADQKLSEIETSTVERRFVDARIRLVGTVDYDETRIKSISSYVPGRIDRLYINYTGIEVQEGDHLADLYSPELLTAQEELLEAKRRVGSSAERSEFLRGSDKRALESAREKLRLYGFSENQLRDIEKKGSPSDHMLIEAPLSGVVIKKEVNEGQYVSTGSMIYTVADLDKLWVRLDAYESDITWLHFGQPVDLQTEAYPGEHFNGTIAFIDPVLDSKTRTIKIRVNVGNPDGRLKPGMFVQATVHARVASGGKVMEPSLSGKWISPMHPEIVSDQPGDCPICGMELVKAEDLGYVSADDEASKPLVIPVSAVLKTGRRAVAYVEVPDTENPTYEGREIVLGPRTGDFYIVKSGVNEGERVVTNGSFNIDSALQIKARPSMMSMEGESPEEMGDIVSFRLALEPLFGAYFNTQTHLASDELETAKEAFKHVEHILSGIDMTLLEGETHDFWMDQLATLKRASRDLKNAESIEAARESFRDASTGVIALEKRFGHTGNEMVHEVYCPMAFGVGASWLQQSDTISNPYMGAEMPTCGSIKSMYEPHAAREASGASGHQH